MLRQCNVPLFGNRSNSSKVQNAPSLGSFKNPRVVVFPLVNRILPTLNIGALGTRLGQDDVVIRALETSCTQPQLDVGFLVHSMWTGPFFLDVVVG